MISANLHYDSSSRLVMIGRQMSMLMFSFGLQVSNEVRIDSFKEYRMDFNATRIMRG
jgi:hypothetical protein